MPAVSEFTNSNGVRRLSSLFFEMCRDAEERKNAIYTLKNKDHKGLPSLYLLYMQCEDPYEYTFVMKHLCDWEHWQLLCEKEWFKPYVERWRKELELSIKAKALAQLINESTKPTREGLSAAKFLLEKGWVEKPAKGRPSNDDIATAAKQIAQEKQDVYNHKMRLGLIDRTTNGIATNRSE